MAEVGGIGDELKSSAERLDVIQAELSALLMAVPNLPTTSVPVGADETANVEVRRWGTPHDASTSRRSDHVDLGAPLGLDFDTGAKLSGSRFTFLRGPVARLHRALAQFMLDVQTAEHGYTECYTPYIVNREILEGTGQLPKFKEDMFWVYRGREAESADEEPREQYLISTSEISLTNTVREQVLAAERSADQADRAQPVLSQRSRQCRARHARHDPPAPVRQGRDGADRASRAERRRRSRRWSATPRRSCRSSACRTASCCCAAATWASAPRRPTTSRSGCRRRAAYREISSCSNCEAFQARRMQARFKNAQGKNEFVHTLNGSGLAVGRTLVAVLENCQNADGSVSVPEALRPYMGGLEALRP